MEQDKLKEEEDKLDIGVKLAIAKAIDRHRRLEESIAVSQDGEVVVIPAEEILIYYPNLLKDIQKYENMID